MKNILQIDRIERKIHFVRGHKVMLDMDLAVLYGVQTKRLKQQVNRNLERFPDDFLIRLTWEESQSILGSRLQNATLKRGYNLKYSTYAFTEQGVAMLSSILRTRRAILVNVAIMRAFVQLRHVLSTHKDLARKLEGLEKHLLSHNRKFRKVNKQMKEIFRAIWQLMNEPKRRVGFSK